jgi:GNAT superfamily N-acetyltransferase
VTLSISTMAYDDPVAVALIQALADDLDERYGAEDDDGDGWFAEVTPEKVVAPHGVFLVASWDGTPVGCGALKRLGPTTGEIKRMYTAPAGRRKGVARAVLARLEDEARALGYADLQLETGDVQQEAVAMYESDGWTRIPGYGRYKDDPRTICFRKDL